MYSAIKMNAVELDGVYICSERVCSQYQELRTYPKDSSHPGAAQVHGLETGN